MDWLHYTFMQRALVSGVIIAVTCPLMGLFLVLRRQALIGETLAHTSLAGVALGLMLGLNPTLSGLAFILASALGIEVLRRHYAHYAELALSVIMAGGVSLGVILLSLGGSQTAAVMSFLFGSLLTITTGDLWLVLALGLGVLTVLFFIYPQMCFISFSEETAAVTGLPVRTLNLIFTLLTGLTIGFSVQLLGVLLVSSLITIPVAASLQVAGSFRQAALLAVAFSLWSTVAGLFISFYANLPPGGAIILLSVITLCLVLAVKHTRQGRQAAN